MAISAGIESVSVDWRRERLREEEEEDDVEVVEEMVALITAQRAYEINSRSIQTADEMLSAATQIVR